ncbi:MAG: hypothetical protein ABEH58_04630, partial [Haloplanus sp.]
MSPSHRAVGTTTGAVALASLQWGFEPTSVVSSDPGRAIASLLLVLGVGTAVRYWRPGQIERAVEAS